MKVIFWTLLLLLCGRDFPVVFAETTIVELPKTAPPKPPHQQPYVNSVALRNLNSVPTAIHYFTATLGCKKINKEGELHWDNDPHLWEVGMQIQKGVFNLDDFILTLESSNTDILYRKEISEKDRKRLVEIVKDILLPFEQDRL